jgi:hypothetical protein
LIRHGVYSPQPVWPGSVAPPLAPGVSPKLS